MSSGTLEIEYPAVDPPAKTEIHAALLRDLQATLKHRFRAAPRVYVGVKTPLYWVEGDLGWRKTPDLFVAFGVPKEPARRAWKVWEEGKAPDLAIELPSRETWYDDMFEKWQVYAELGVREYFLFDPEYDQFCLPEPLLAWRLVEGEYQLQPVSEGAALSEVLGLELVNTGTTLRLRDPQTGEFLLTEAEEIARAKLVQLKRQPAKKRGK